MEPRIENVTAKKVVGQRIKTNMSSQGLQTVELWKTFMPRKSAITHPVSSDLLSIQIYDDETDFESFNENTVFEKWAAVEVKSFENIPEGMETHLLAGGLYAVFTHVGFLTTFPMTLQYIFGTWLPQSKYNFDSREQFEVMGEKYNPASPNSEEEIWIPIKLK